MITDPQILSIFMQQIEYLCLMHKLLLLSLSLERFGEGGKGYSLSYCTYCSKLEVPTNQTQKEKFFLLVKFPKMDNCIHSVFRYMLKMYMGTLILHLEKK